MDDQNPQPQLAMRVALVVTLTSMALAVVSFAFSEFLRAGRDLTAARFATGITQVAGATCVVGVITLVILIAFRDLRGVARPRTQDAVETGNRPDESEQQVTSPDA